VSDKETITATGPLPCGPYQTDLLNYIEQLWDNGSLERHEKGRLFSCINFTLMENWRDTLTQAAKLTCPLCHSGHKVYFDEATCPNPCEATYQFVYPTIYAVRFARCSVVCTARMLAKCRHASPLD
jgi:hypothetical protein